MQETWETQVQSLGWKDSLEKEMANHSNIPAWEIPWTEEPGGLSDMTEQLKQQAAIYLQSLLPFYFKEICDWIERITLKYIHYHM